MRKNFYSIILVVILLAFISGCDNLGLLSRGTSDKSSMQKPPIGETVIAKIGNFYVTETELNKEIEAYNRLLEAQGLGQSKIQTRDQKVNYLRKEIVNKYLLYQEALDRRLDKRAEIVDALENAKITLLVTELLKEETDKINVTSKEIEDFYDKNKDLLREPEQRRILEIMVPTEADAKQVYIELLKGSDFAGLAKQYSKAPTADKGGDVGFLTLEFDPAKRVRFDKFYEVAFSPTLDVGAISNIFKGSDGYYIIKLDRVKKAEVKSLSELWDNIKAYLMNEKQQKTLTDLANRLSAETKIEIYEGKVQ